MSKTPFIFNFTFYIYWLQFCYNNFNYNTYINVKYKTTKSYMRMKIPHWKDETSSVILHGFYL